MALERGGCIWWAQRVRDTTVFDDPELLAFLSLVFHLGVIVLFATAMIKQLYQMVAILI